MYIYSLEQHRPRNASRNPRTSIPSTITKSPPSWILVNQSRDAMPRPKRRKVAPSAPALQSVTDQTKKTTVASIVGRQKLAGQRTRQGHNQEAETTTRLTRPVRVTRQGRVGKGEDAYMSGALEAKDQHSIELPKVSADLVLVPSTAESPREDITKAIQRTVIQLSARSNSRNTSTPLNLENFRRRARPASILGTAQSDAEESDVEVGRGLVGGTPGIRSSVLALEKFKRRPRQSSILAVGRSDQSLSDSGDISLSLDDSFNPEDGSTPFHIAKTRAKNALNKSASIPSAQFNPRKRKITPVPPLSSPPIARDRPARSQDEDLYDLSDSSPNCSRSKLQITEKMTNPLSPTMAPPLSSSPITSRNREPRGPSIEEFASQRPQSPDSRPRATSTDTETTAPTSPIRKSTLRGRAPKSNAAPQRKSMSTADLQSFLPKRRRHSVLRSGSRGTTPANAFDIPSSSNMDDSAGLLASASSSELEDNVPRHRLAEKRNAIFTKKQAKVPKQRPPLKSSGHGPSLTRATSKRPSTTYGAARRGSSDKENSSLTNDSLDPTNDADEDEILDSHTTTAKGTKLSRISKKTYGTVAKKFKEVDEWALEFEDVSQRTLDSSPWDAR